MDSTPIYQYAKPTSASLGPPKSSEPIITHGFELSPCFIKLIQDKSFSGEDNENSYPHLREFEQTCACLRIAGMSNKTLRWKLVPFSLTRKAKHWYSQTIGSMQGDWESYALNFIYISFIFLKWLPLERGSKF
jgi:hypothetical protein